MIKNLIDIVKADMDPKNKDIEIQTYLEEILLEVINENNIELSIGQQEEIIYNFREIIDYKKATDEYIKEYYESILKISK